MSNEPETTTAGGPRAAAGSTARVTMTRADYDAIPPLDPDETGYVGGMSKPGEERRITHDGRQYVITLGERRADGWALVWTDVETTTLPAR